MNDLIVKRQNKLSKFIVVAHDKDCSGLGFAKIILNGNTGRGYNPDWKNYIKVLFTIIKDAEDMEQEDDEKIEMIGEGIVDKIDFEELWKSRNKYKDYGWIFDGNHNSDKGEQLRKEGFYVFGGLKLTDKMEHDREFGLSIIKKAGLITPEFEDFSDIQKGIDFLEKNENKAYVFKPDDPDGKSWVTTCPDNDNDYRANEEIRKFLMSQKGNGNFILQHRIKGVEMNVEMWLYKGKPFFAHANFENKRKHNGELGKMIGCAMDVEFVIPLESKILKETVWKLTKLPEFKDYTGYLDMNIIKADNEYYFLEFCARFGYNSHPNIFLTLSISPMSEILSDFILGNVENFGRHFRSGFGSSMTCLIDDPVMGLPIIFDDKQDVESRFYHFDTMKDDEDYYLCGTGNEVGIICSHDYDIKSSAEECLRKFHKIHYSGKFARTDLANDDYFNNPRERYIACQSMELFNKL